MKQFINYNTNVMKTRNFPAKKLKRQMIANGIKPEDNESLLNSARQSRTKKDRSVKGLSLI